MSELIRNLKSQSPAYAALSDEEFAGRMYDKFYAGQMNRAEFNRRVGIGNIGLAKASALGAADAVNFNTTDEIAGRGLGVWATIKSALSGDSQAQGRLSSAVVEPVMPAVKAVQSMIDPQARQAGADRAALNRARVLRLVTGKASEEDKQGLSESARESGDFAVLATAPFSPLAQLRLALKASETASDPNVEAETVQSVREDQIKARTERPAVYYGSGIAASLVTPPGVAAAKSAGNAVKVAAQLKSPAAIKAAAAVSKPLLKAAATGAAYGTASAMGDEEGDLANRAETALDPRRVALNAALGVGGYVGGMGVIGAAQTLGKGGGWLARRLARAAKRPDERQAETIAAVGDLTDAVSAPRSLQGEIKLPDFDTTGADLAGKARAEAAAKADVEGGAFFDKLEIPATRGQRMGDTDAQQWERLALEGAFGEDAAKTLRPVFEDQGTAFANRVQAIGRVPGEIDPTNELEAAALLQSGVRDAAEKLRGERNVAYDAFGGRKTTLPKGEPSKLAPNIEIQLEKAGILDSRPAALRAKGIDTPDRTDLPALYSDTYRALDHIRAVTARMDADDSFRTLQNLEPTRIVINQLMNKAAKNEDGLDMRGLAIIKDAFDEWERKAFERAGKLSAKGQREVPIMLEARSAHGRMAQFEEEPALKHILSDPKANEASVLDRLFGAGGINAKSGSLPAIRTIKEEAGRRAFPEANGGYRAEDLNARELAGYNEAWRALRAGALQRLLKVGDGKYATEAFQEARGAAAMPWQKLHDNLNSALNSNGWPIMRELFTPEEIQTLELLRQVSARLTVKRGAQNASGTAIAQGYMARAWLQRLGEALKKTRITFAAEIGEYTRDKLAAGMAEKAARAPTGKVEYAASDRAYDLVTGLKDLLVTGLNPNTLDAWPAFSGAMGARIGQTQQDNAQVQGDVYGQ